MGVAKELILRGLMPEVVSGVSGGSIVAAMLATRTDQEMLDDVIQEDISTRYLSVAEGGDGHNVRWFPSLFAQIRHFVETGTLINNRT